MSWIREVEGLKLSNVIKVMSINPAAMQAVQNLNQAITFGSSALTRTQEEAISTTVAVLNKCRFWAMAHGALLRQWSDDSEMTSHVMHDYRNADLDAETRGMLDFVRKLTLEPGEMEESDIIGLRELGLSDEQILSVVLITCNFSFMTRLADGLGVEFPSQNQATIEKWLAGPATEQDWMMKQKG